LLIDNGLARIHLLELEYAQAMRRAEVAWVRRLVNEIKSGSLIWKTEEDQP
jgi:hypothetical protein